MPHSQYKMLVLTDCGEITVPHGVVSSSETHLGAEVEVTCDRGYTLWGDSVVRCLENTAFWSDTPSCDIVGM